MNANCKIQGDASRPRTVSLPLTGNTTNDSLHPPVDVSPSRVFNSGVVERWFAWDEPLASLFVMKPNLKLDDVDVMVHDSALFQLFTIASRRSKDMFRSSGSNFAFDISLINNTLVIQKRTKTPKVVLLTPLDWHHYEAATVPMPGVEYSSVHCQLLRYNIGPLSCVVSTRVNGTVQQLPTIKEPSKPQKKRHVNGIDIIIAGQGVLPAAAFQAILRPRQTDRPLDGTGKEGRPTPEKGPAPVGLRPD